MTREDYDIKLTANFYLYEFLFSDFYSPFIQQRVIEEWEGSPETQKATKELAENLQVLREFLGAPISINISFRPHFWEIKQGRSGNSQHVKGWAADIICDSYTPEQVANAIEGLIESGQMKEGGLGRYNSFTHYDLRGFKARWDKT